MKISKNALLVKTLVGLVLTGLVFILVSSLVLQFKPSGCIVQYGDVSLYGWETERCTKQEASAGYFNFIHVLILLTVPYLFLGFYMRKVLYGRRPFPWVLPLVAIVTEKVLISWIPRHFGEAPTKIIPGYSASYVFGGIISFLIAYLMSARKTKTP